MSRPGISLAANAWVNGAPLGPSMVRLRSRAALASPIDSPPAPLRPPQIELSDWRNDQVGWGLVLPENPALTPAQRARPGDAPEPIQHLWDVRGRAPVLRYDPDHPSVVSPLRRYYDDGSQDPHLVGSKRGTGKGRLPRYLLMVGSPTELPWALQYKLGHVAYTGRLDLSADGLENYVAALCADWVDAGAHTEQALTWSTFHGMGDITPLMLKSIGEAVHRELCTDPGLRSDFVDGSKTAATHEALRQKLAELRPALIVTTSHGCTGPLDDLERLRSDLGLLVDNDGAILDVDALLDHWSPGGAVWYAHACCSAGAAARSLYHEVLEQIGPVGDLLDSLTRLGDVAAPLPHALLGAPDPLRAFVGHVEPTFDVTLRSRQTGQILTDSTRKALYNRLYKPQPIGLALDDLHRQATTLRTLQKEAVDRFGAGEDTEAELLALCLTAGDRESLVLLGDPTAALPDLWADPIEPD